MKTLVPAAVALTTLCGFACAQHAAANPPQRKSDAADRLRLKIPAWASQTRSTPHFVYYFSPKDQPVQASLDAQEEHYSFFAKIFQVHMPPRVYYLKYPDAKTFEMDAPKGSGGFLAGNCIHSRWWFHPHEAVHAYLPSRNRFLSQGIAEAFGTSFYQGWQDFGQAAPLTKDALIQSFFRAPNQQDRFLSNNFIRWVFYRFGARKLAAIAQRASLNRNETLATVRQVFSTSLPDLASQWERDQQWLKQQKPPEGFFVRAPWSTEERSTKEGD